MDTTAPRPRVDVAAAASTVAVGAVIGLLALVLMVSFSSLIFTGPLTDLAPRGLGVMLVSCIVVVITVGVLSPRPGMIAIPQDSVAAVMAVAAGQAAAATGLTGDAVMPTVLATLAAASIGIGLVYLTMGRLRLAVLVRYVPYPVVGGFLGGTGWVLVAGAFGVITGTDLSVASARSRCSTWCAGW